MMRIFTFCLLTLMASVTAAQNYTLMTTLPPKVAKGEVATESFFIEVAQETFKRADLHLRTKKGAWIKNQNKVMAAQAAKGLMIVPLTRTEDREAKYDWILPIITYKLIFVTNDRAVDISNIEALKSMPVCAFRESPAEYKLKELGFEKIHARVHEQKCFHGLKKKTEKIMLAHGKISAAKGYKLVRGNSEKLIYGPEFSEETIYLASTKGAVSDDDKAKLIQAFESLKADGSFEKTRAKY
jgi:polar amino acid transport system substrate-binding protein